MKREPLITLALGMALGGGVPCLMWGTRLLDRQTAVSTGIGTLIGGLISCIASWGFGQWYYAKSGEELQAEAAQLKRMSIIMLEAMHDAGLVKLSRGPDGTVVGRVVDRAMSDTIRATGEISFTVERRPPPVYDRQQEQPETEA